MEEQGVNWLSSLKEIGPWILGFIALVQVWIIGLWKRLRRGKIAIYESGLIEIGYGDLGPSVAVIGTLRCFEKDVFVKRMAVIVTRKKDGSRHTFRWHAFRPTEVSLGTQETTKLELAASFLATPAQPYKYNIFFTESAFLSEYRPKVQPFLREWHAFVNAKLQKMGDDFLHRAFEILGNTSVVFSLYREFSDAGKATDTYTTLDRAFYWEEGKYDLTLIVEASNPDREFTKSWQFELSKEDSDRLRLNVVAILQSMCGVRVTYNFAYPEYRSLDT